MTTSQPQPTGTNEMNNAFILRLTWCDDALMWRISLKSATGGNVLLFADLESAFLHLARLYTDQELGRK
jgi:hypothetical protein